MYRLTELLRGYVRAELEGADTARFLNLCAETGVELQRAQPLDALHLRLRLRRRALRGAQAAAERSGCTLRLVSERGVPKALRRLRGRYFLLAGALLAALGLLWSSLHVWELEVEGCADTGEGEILAALDKAGVAPGSFWPDFVNERIKCRVLREIPSLSWMAVRVQGSRAVAAVREAVPAPVIYDAHAPADIVAEKPGLITQVRPLMGTAAVEAGQTVTTGDALVLSEMRSSFEKAGARQVHAVAQVYARTWYSLSACAPLTQTEKTFTGREKLRLALEIGGRRINFYNVSDNSRNLDVEYDKLSRTYRLAIPGVFTTPLAVTVERARAYVPTETARSRALLSEQLQAHLTQRLLREIGEDGEVRSSAFSVSERDGMLYVTLHAECLEDIACERAVT